MDYDSIEEVVREHVSFTHGTSSKGWNTVYCSVCGDGSRTQGPRGGWLFDGDIVFYNCFNCGVDGSFTPLREIPFSENMHSIFRSFGVPLNKCYFLVEKFGNKPKEKVKVTPLKFDTLEIPDHFYKLNSAGENDVIAKKAITHLVEKRRIDPDDFPFYLSTGKTSSSNPKDVNMARAFQNRLIIPAYANDRLIGYEGMALGNQKSKYISAGSNLIHGYNNIFGKDEHIPLFVTEGFFDSYFLNGVAVLTNKISSRQIELLRRTNRPKIIVPDRKNTHNALADKAIELGWGLSLPEIRPYRDVSEAVQHLGILFVANSVMNNIKYGKIAQISLKLYNLA